MIRTFHPNEVDLLRMLSRNESLPGVLRRAQQSQTRRNIVSFLIFMLFVNGMVKMIFIWWWQGGAYQHQRKHKQHHRYWALTQLKYLCWKYSTTVQWYSNHRTCKKQDCLCDPGSPSFLSFNWSILDCRQIHNQIVSRLEKTDESGFMASLQLITLTLWKIQLLDRTVPMVLLL